MSSGEAFSMAERVCAGDRRSGRVKDSDDCCDEPLRLPPLRESTKFWTMEETSLEGAALVEC